MLVLVLLVVTITQEKTQGLRRDRTQIERRAQRHEQTVARLKRELEQVEDEMAALPSDSHNEVCISTVV